MREEMERIRDQYDGVELSYNTLVDIHRRVLSVAELIQQGVNEFERRTTK